jgi:hypothetical protein
MEADLVRNEWERRHALYLKEYNDIKWGKLLSPKEQGKLLSKSEDGNPNDELFRTGRSPDILYLQFFWNIIPKPTETELDRVVGERQPSRRHKLMKQIIDSRKRNTRT